MDTQFGTLRDELNQTLKDLTVRQTQLRPFGIDKWSIQQITGHLLLTYALTIDAFEARLAKGNATKATPTIAQHLGQFTILTIGHFPKGRTAPDRVCERSSAAAVPGCVLITRVDSAILELDCCAAAGAEMFGPDHRAISHMLLGPLSVNQWRRFHLVHGRHHIRQIAGIRLAHGL